MDQVILEGAAGGSRVACELGEESEVEEDANCAGNYSDLEDLAWLNVLLGNFEVLEDFHTDL